MLGRIFNSGSSVCTTVLHKSRLIRVPTRATLGRRDDYPLGFDTQCYLSQNKKQDFPLKDRGGLLK